MTFVLKVGREDASAAAAECAICGKEKEPRKENASHSVLLLLPLLCPAAIEIESETEEKNILEEGGLPVFLLGLPRRPLFLASLFCVLRSPPWHD